MPSRPMTVAVAFALVAGLIAGCQSRLSFETTRKLDPGQVINFSVDSPRYDQKVAVEFSADNEVGVYVCLEKDRDSVDDALISVAKKMPEILGSNPKAKSGTVEVTVPAKERFYVFLAGAAKPTTVTVKVTGK
jgi:hypothetical protein